MPFTFCHPAIILPLNKIKYFSLTALIMGSMMPDFEYFIRMRIVGKYGHTLGGIFYFSLPLGLICCFIFHNWVRNPLIENLPLFFKSRFRQFESFNWNWYFKKHWIIVISSLILGTFSHLFWDAFTHYNGYFVIKIPSLQSQLNLFDIEIPVYNFLQHFSSLLGAVLIMFFIWRIPADSNLENYNYITYWLWWIFVTSGIIFLRILLDPQTLPVGDLVVTSISAGLLALFFSPLLLSKRN